jgi:hypothetical protein
VAVARVQEGEALAIVRVVKETTRVARATGLVVREIVPAAKGTDRVAMGIDRDQRAIVRLVDDLAAKDAVREALAALEDAGLVDQKVLSAA